MNILSHLKKFDKMIPLAPTDKIILGNTYYQMNLKGTSPTMFLREAVWMQLCRASEQLPHPYAFYLFDTYRSLETQKDLFQFIYTYLKSHHNLLNETTLMEKTRTFVADPFNLAIRHKLSHPTGSAIDLGLFDLDQKKLVDMGTPFDDPTDQSATHYYANSTHKDEQQFHSVRTLLYQLMIDFDFTNYDKEWWHYDLGDYSWSNKKNISWHYSIVEQLHT